MLAGEINNKARYAEIRESAWVFKRYRKVQIMG
jgi:hypothetical protein